MEEVAGWIAPAATMIAAMMTAANLGTRVTGWGFVVFMLGSVAWCAVAVATGQNNLLVTNGFLTLVNIVGIWRWLGREARYDRDAQTLSDESKARTTPTLVPAASLTGTKVRDRSGEDVAEVVDAMIGSDGRLHALLVRHGGVGGVGETVSVLDFAHVWLQEKCVQSDLDAAAIARLPEADRG